MSVPSTPPCGTEALTTYAECVTVSCKGQISLDLKSVLFCSVLSCNSTIASLGQQCVNCLFSISDVPRSPSTV
jgi:hypothetical protein